MIDPIRQENIKKEKDYERIAWKAYKRLLKDHDAETARYMAAKFARKEVYRR